jgi:uncharacterized protein (TIGR03437 family)
MERRLLVHISIMRPRASFFSVELIFLSFSAQAATGPVYSHILPSLGAPNSTTITAMTTDSAGNVYAAGFTMNDAFPVTKGVVQPKFGSGLCILLPSSIPLNFTICPDAFVMKLDAQGKVAFATYLGGSGWDEATSIDVDGAGNIYIAGSTSSSNFPRSPGARFAGPGTTFLAKLNPTGTALLYTALIPGTGDLSQMRSGFSNVAASNVAMAVDQAGNAYFASYGAPGFPVTQHPSQASGPIAVGKLDPTGSTLLYSTYLGGTGSDSVSGIALDSTGDVYITGSTNSQDFPVTAGALQTSLQSSVSNSFVAKLNTTGDKLIYATYLGATSFAYTDRIRVDGSGNVYVLGGLQSPGYPVTPNAFETTYTLGAGFLSKLNADGTALVYSTFLSTPPSTLFLATNAHPPSTFDIDAAGNAYVAGMMGSGFSVSSDALQPCYGGGGDDIFVAEFSADGALARATYLGGSNIENTYAIAVAVDGTLVLMGNTSSADFPVTRDSPLTAPGYFLSRFHISDPANATSPCLTLALQNGATFREGPIAPGELITLRGLRFGPDVGVGAQLDSSSNIATEASGVRVFFDSLAAPLLYAQSQQINAQVPWELAGQSATKVHVEYNGLSTQIADAAVVPYAPAFFQADTSGQGAILNEDGTLNSASNPAKIGSVVAIFGTGAGPTAPAGITGGIAPLAPLALLTSPISVQVNGTDAEILYAGSAPTIISGVFQINFRVPANLPFVGPYLVHIKVGTQAGDESVIIAISS